MNGHEGYRCVAGSVEGFVSQVIRYVASGHYFYLTGRIPRHKNPVAVDRKLITLYDIDRPRWARARRRLGKLSGVHYLRHNQFFVILATHGQSRFFEDHQQSFRDIRRNALHVGGYSIRYTWSATDKRWRVFVRLDRETYKNLRARMLDLALRERYRSAIALEAVFAALPWQPYGPVRLQIRSIIGAVNRRRRYAGYAKIRLSCIPKIRRIETVFAEETQSIGPAELQLGESVNKSSSSSSNPESAAKLLQNSSA